MLVFLGLLISSFQELPSDAPQAVKSRSRNATWRAFAAFALSLATVALATAWLAIPGGDAFYWAVVAVFAVDLGGILLAAALATGKLLR